MRSLRLTSIVAFLILTRGGFGLMGFASEPSAASPLSTSVDSNTVSSARPETASLPFGTVEDTNAAPHALDESEVKNLLTAVLQRDYVRDLGELDLTLGHPWASVTVSNAPVLLKVVEVPTLGVASSFIVRFELVAGNESLGLWQMPLAARVWRDVWVAHSQLHRGQVFGNADCVRERRDVLTTREAYLGGDTEPAELELAQGVSPGATILTHHLKPRTLVRRGQVAEAVVRDGGMAISLKVEVLEDGTMGQQVRVRNVQSNHEFRGKVENEGTISVSL
ncbi:MAG: flagellar basal body P-ring formation chaperone FlgA [Verrucomicrobiia bacterium]